MLTDHLTEKMNQDRYLDYEAKRNFLWAYSQNFNRINLLAVFDLCFTNLEFSNGILSRRIQKFGLGSKLDHGCCDDRFDFNQCTAIWGETFGNGHAS
jgi:hypothetical protein